jgi:transposase
MSAREALIFDVNDGMSVSEAAEEHGVARSCAYKWVSRYQRLGWAGLEELSRRPELSPERTSQELVDELVGLKKKYPAWGPAKLVAMLDERHGEHVMAVSTAGQILARLGMVAKRRPRHRSAGRIEHSPYEVAGAGDSMTADYKGQFRMGNGALCYPLTVADPFSRYVMAIEAMASTHMVPAKSVFERVFRKYGVPRQMITDNGTPFCGAGSLGGLTQLSRWWIEIGSCRSESSQAARIRTGSTSGCIERSRIGSGGTSGRTCAVSSEASMHSGLSSMTCVRIRVWDRSRPRRPFGRTGRCAQVHARSNTTATWMYDV